MAKKSQKRPVRHERGQSSCMWGLISMFDFRHGLSIQKLLSDRKRGTRHVAAGNAMDQPEMLITLDEKCQGTAGAEESIIAAADSAKASVKKLMEDDMFCEKDLKKGTSSAEVDPKQSQRKSRKRTNRSRTKSCEIYMEDLDAAENLQPEKPCLQCSEKHSTNSLDMDDMVEEFCRQIHRINCLKHDQHGQVHDQPNPKNHDFDEKLREAVELFIRHRLINGKQDTGDGDIHPSKGLKDALKILSSDEELSLKLLQGPKSVMVKYIENLWNAQVEKEEVSKPLVGSNLSEQEMHNLKQTDEVAQSKHRKFFRRKAKSFEKTSSKASKATQASNKIVILKPGPAGLEKPETEGSIGPSPEPQPFIRYKGPDERVGSYFFLSEIKRKLKQAMGKEQHEIAPDGISNRFPTKHRTRGGTDKRYKENVGRNSPSKDHFFIEKIARPSVGVKKGEKTNRLKESETSREHETANYPKHRLSNIYVEAKKHLSEMVTSGNGDVEFSSRQLPKTLGRILSLPEYNFSPLGSPVRDLGQSFVTAQMRFSARDKFQKQENNISHLGRLTPDSESELHVSDETTNSKVEAYMNPDSSTSDGIVQDIEVENIPCSVGEGKISEGNVEEIVQVAEILVKEDINVLDFLAEPSDSSMIRGDKSGGSSEVSDAKGYSECLKAESDEEIQPLSSLVTFSIAQKDDDLDGAVEVSDRPSPVSVLEPLFTEEDISPASTRSQPAEISMQPRRIQFEEHGPSAEDLGTHLKACIQEKESVFEYIKGILEASEVNWDEFYIMSNSSDPLLDPSIYDEVGFFPNQLCYDKKLLFDCINEVLLEVYGRYFGCPLGLSFGKPSVQPAPDMNYAIHAVWEGVYWYLLPLPLPHTLEQIVKKDMAKTGSWMDLRCDSEAMVIEIGESIFKDLIEENMLSCINDSGEGGNRLIPVESKDESSIDL